MQVHINPKGKAYYGPGPKKMLDYIRILYHINMEILVITNIFITI